MNYKGLELKLCEIVERRLEEGWVLEPGCYRYADSSRMCLVSILSLEDDDACSVPYSSRRFAAEKHGLEEEVIAALEAGFEGWVGSDAGSTREAAENLPGVYKLGQRIRRLYVVDAE